MIYKAYSENTKDSVGNKFRKNCVCRMRLVPRDILPQSESYY
jgi:hypothetical protein